MIKEEIDNNFKILNMINDWIKNADTKASIALAFWGIFIGFVLSKNYSFIIDFKEINCFIVSYNVLLFLIYGGCFVSAIFLLKALVAKISNTNVKKSNTYYGLIEKLSLEEYKESQSKITSLSLNDDLIEQIYTNSKICTKKMMNYKIGIITIIITIVVLLLFISLNAVGG